jgi:ABC-type multidrug transport system fused ATPase/permease subunit
MTFEKFRFLFFEFFQKKKTLGVLFFLSVICGVLDLGVPFLAQHSLDHIFPSKNLHLLASFAAMVGGFYGIYWGLGLGISFLNTQISLQSSKEIRIRMHRLSLENYSEGDEKTAIETLLRIESDAIALVHFFLKSLDGVGRNALTLILGFVLLGIQDLCLLILFLVYASMQCGVAQFFSRVLCGIAASSRKIHASVFAMLQEHLSGKRIIALLRVQKFFENQFLKIQESRFSLEKKSAWWRRLESLFGTGISFLFKMGVGVYLARALMTGHLSAGQAAFLVILLPKLHSYFLQLLGVLRDMKMMREGGLRLFEVLKTKENKNPKELKIVSEFQSLVFKNVFFSRDGKEVIYNLSFAIKRGEKLVFYGPSGCGKTTVWLLMLGLLKPTSGKILLNGDSFEMVDLKSWFGVLSILPQENEWFKISWDENVRLGREGRLSNSPLLNFLPLQESGSNKIYCGEQTVFSKGELQRLVVARALFNDAPVLLLDEPDAHWDESFSDRMRDFFFGCSEKTVLIFTHRVSWIQKAEKKISLEREEMGRV